MKLLKSTQEILTKDKNSEDVLQLKITEVVLVHSNIINNQNQHDSRGFLHLFPLSPLSSYEKFHQQITSTQNHFILSLHTLKYHLLIKTLSIETEDRKM